MRIKRIIKKIPVLGNLATSVKQLFIKPDSDFRGSRDYWVDRYRTGGNSGAGSYNHLAEFKGEVVNSFVRENTIKSVIEFGSGDGNQLDYFEFESYLGFDISNDAVMSCREKFSDDESKSFRHADEYAGEKAEMTMSLDVIYHLIEDEVFDDYMSRLFGASQRFVVIYSSNTGINKDGVDHVKHREFVKWVNRERPDFELLKVVENKYPYDGDWRTTSFADFYFFEKKNEHAPSSHTSRQQ